MTVLQPNLIKNKKKKKKTTTLGISDQAYTIQVSVGGKKSFSET